MSESRTAAAIDSTVVRLRTATSAQHAIEILSTEDPAEPPMHATEIRDALTAAGWNAYQAGTHYWHLYAPDGSGPLIIIEPRNSEPEATNNPRHP